jgi:hypothetical protein
VFLYPAATVFAIVVTANHYFADVIAGLLLLAVAYGLARLLTARVDRIRTGPVGAPRQASGLDLRTKVDHR